MWSAHVLHAPPSAAPPIPPPLLPPLLQGTPRRTPLCTSTTASACLLPMPGTRTSSPLMATTTAVGGWMDGWVGGWVGGHAGMRAASRPVGWVLAAPSAPPLHASTLREQAHATLPAVLLNSSCLPACLAARPCCCSAPRLLVRLCAHLPAASAARGGAGGRRRAAGAARGRPAAPVSVPPQVLLRISRWCLAGLCCPSALGRDHL